MKKVILLTPIFLIILLACKQVPTKSDSMAKNLAGINYMNESKYEQALQEFTEAVKNPLLDDDTRGVIYRNIALTYGEMQNRDSAVHFYTIAAKVYEKNSYGYLVNMAGADLQNGKTQNALTRLLKAAAINPEELGVNNALGLIYLGDYDVAFADPEKALPYNKKANELSSGRVTEDILGRNYYELGNYTTAAMYYEKLHSQYPGNLNYTYNCGMIKYKLNRNEDAEELFNQVIAQDSSYKERIGIFKENNR